jgi:hypothetical protein
LSNLPPNLPKNSVGQERGDPSQDGFARFVVVCFEMLVGKEKLQRFIDAPRNGVLLGATAACGDGTIVMPPRAYLLRVAKSVLNTL